ncbi:MAG: hypothetical protein JSV45_08295 [Chromatiales bacterium]|nr:MAG: hypothetical protein JSV45_08295 [Chromatiales bacterium]
MKTKTLSIMATVPLYIASLGAVAWAEPSHPLDSLTRTEFETVTRVLTEAGRIDETSRFALVHLAAPDKKQVLVWRPGEELGRRAFASIRHDRQMYEAVVDLDKDKVVSWELIEGVQPALLDSEWVLSQQILRKDPAWQAALARRGLGGRRAVFCFPAFPGNFDRDWDQGNRRLGMVSCYATGSDKGLWGRPVEGLLAVVDYDEKTIVEIIDTGEVPVPEGGPAVARNQPTDMPAGGAGGRRFVVDGHWVSWDRWQFHLTIDPRVGPVLSQLSVSDGKRQRPVMYQGFASELFVPYMDPNENWYFRTYLDVGEYGIGASGTPLRLGKDCPADGELMGATFMGERGKPSEKRDLVCIFERITGDAAWSHYEMANQGSSMRRHTELVVRFIVWLGNYDYVLDYIFTETGSLKVRVGATGVVLTKAVTSQNMGEERAAEESAYGRLIAPGLVAVNHDHFFNFRLDLDVDGRNNSMVVDRLKRVDLDPAETGTPRRQIWQVFPELATNESDAMLNVQLARPALWRVINPGVENAAGNPVSFQLRPGKTAMTLLNDGEIAHRRAGFTAYHLWVTPYRGDEKYAAGDYPNRHPGGAGLPAWTSADRSIENTDLVLWYTVGMHHVVRAEDWPIMPVVHHEFEIRPFDFFDYNPTVTGENGNPEP